MVLASARISSLLKRIRIAGGGPLLHHIRQCRVTCGWAARVLGRLAVLVMIVTFDQSRTPMLHSRIDRRGCRRDPARVPLETPP